MKTFVVVGLGRFGSAVARRLFELGHEVLAIDTDEAVVQKISDYSTHAVVGDAKDEHVLRSLGVRNYECAIVAIGENITDSVLITLALKEIGVPQIVCKAMDATHKKILLKIGADMVVIPENAMGIKLADQLASMNVIDYLELSENFGISEIRVPDKWVGKTLRGLDVRRRFNITVIAIKDGDDTSQNMIVAPDADYALKKEDVLVILGRNEDLNSIGVM